MTDLTSVATGQLIGRYTNESNVTIDLFESVTELVDNGDGTFTFTSEDGTVVTMDTADIETLTSVSNILAAGNRIATYTDENNVPIDVFESVTTLVDNGDGTFTFTSEDGTVVTMDTVDLETLTAITDTIVGNQIGIYRDENNGLTAINETITSIEVIDGGFVFTAEDGSQVKVGDNDTLGNLSCLAGESIVFNGTAWVCTPAPVPQQTITIYEETHAAGSTDGFTQAWARNMTCLLYTSPSPRDATLSRMPSSA